MKKQNVTEEMEIANGGMSRRSFLGLGALGAAGLAALGLSGCAPQANSTATAEPSGDNLPAEELPPAGAEESCDVVVVGLGTSGLVAASAAAKEGAKVIGLDRSASMGATNAAMVSGVWAVESAPELAEPNYLTVKDMFDFIWTGTHYQTNAPLLRNVLPASGKGIDLMIEGGVPFMFAFQGADENTLMLNRGGHIYATSGAERAEALQGMLDKFGVDSRWDAEVTNLLIEDGKVVGVRYQDGSKAIDVKAANTIIATGGFIQNEDMLREYYSGAVQRRRGYQAGPVCRSSDGQELQHVNQRIGCLQHEVVCPFRELGRLQRHAGVQSAFVRRPHGEQAGIALHGRGHHGQAHHVLRRATSARGSVLHGYRRWAYRGAVHHSHHGLHLQGRLRQYGTGRANGL